MEGFGTYNYENGEYYIGHFKNNLRHGQGIYYYKNGKIKYDGEWINNKREGNNSRSNYKKSIIIQANIKMI